MQHIFHSLSEVLKDLEGNEAAREAFVFAAWRRIAGGPLAEHAIPLRLDKKKFVIAVSNETWRKQITDLSSQLIFKLNSALGASLVTFVEFRINAKVVEAARRERASLQMRRAEWETISQKQITPHLRQAAESIADEKLRYGFLLAAGSSLARMKQDRK